MSDLRRHLMPVLFLALVALTVAACGDSGGTGDTGATGDTAETGDTDETGGTGDTDETGGTGDTDETGDTGDVIDTGDVDDSGGDVIGDVGPDPDDTDDTGDTGPGDTDDTGDTGPGGCTTLCDCPQGESCVDGECGLGTSAAFCCANDGCPDGKVCDLGDGALGLCGVASSALAGEVVFNEVLSDGTVDGDPNGDGDAGGAVADEFIELRVVSDASVDLSGASIFNAQQSFKARHTFPAGTVAQPAQYVVVFGGGSVPDDTPGAIYQTANADDGGIELGLSLSNSADAIRLVDADGALIALFAYGPGAPLGAITDESWTRDPEGTGDFVPHSQASGADGALFSPGAAAADANSEGD